MSWVPLTGLVIFGLLVLRLVTLLLCAGRGLGTGGGGLGGGGGISTTGG